MSEWKKVRLGEVAKMMRGKAVTRSSITPGDIPVMLGGREPAYYCNESNHTGPCFIVSRSGASAGYVSYWDEPIFVTDGFLFEGDSKIDTQFLYYSLKARQESLIMSQNGTGIPHVRGEDLKNIELAFPTEAERKRIAAVLSDYDAAIANCRKQIALLEEAAMRLYREWFGDGKGEKKRLSEVVEFDPPTKLMKEKRKFSVPMGALQVNSMVLDKSAFELTMGNSGSKFKNGDTLLARITPCLENGKTAFVFGVDDDGACGSTEFIVMRSKALNPYVVYLLARTESFRKVAIGSMSGADGRQRARKEVIASFEIMVPPDSVIERFGGVCEPIFKQIEALQNLIYRLTEARDRLLPKLMSGEVAV